jgi:probable LLM family oxidoreductase
MKTFELGITTFAEVMEDPITKETPTYDERLRRLIEEIQLAESVDLDYYGVGEHHRSDFAATSPAVILAAGASVTSKIKLGSAVSVLSSDDPVRLYQQFATLQALSNGRAELCAGRGSFIESFPLFGYDLRDYDALYDEKLRLLAKIRNNEFTSHEGVHRPSYEDLGIYPRNEIPFRLGVAVGGTPQSVKRAAELGLPLFLAIIGGEPLRFKPFIDLYRREYLAHGHDPKDMFIAIHSHGYIDLDHDKAIEEYYPSISMVMTQIGKERGWPPYTRQTYNHAISPAGALYVGSPEYVAKKIQILIDELGIQRFTLHVPVGPMAHEKVLQTIEYLGTKVRPLLNIAYNKTTNQTAERETL